MSSSREDSPDWLRCFKAPTVTLSFSSESLPNDSPLRDDKIDSPSPELDDNHGIVHVESGSESPSDELSKAKASLRETTADAIKPKKKKKDVKKGDGSDGKTAEEATSDKQKEVSVSASRIPLLLPEKVNRSKALVECDGESIDLSGDVGAVGRIVIPSTSCGNHETFFDLKGTIYRTTIIPSRTFCVVSFGQSEAKIEAIMNDFIQLKPHSNVYEAETMVEGTLEGFSFDSEDEAEKIPKAGAHQTDQNEGNDEKPNKKTKRKAEKSYGAVQKKGKGGGKPQPTKRATKKSQVSKKAKTKK